jgi:hypothetical protein
MSILRSVEDICLDIEDKTRAVFNLKTVTTQLESNYSELYKIYTKTCKAPISIYIAAGISNVQDMKNDLQHLYELYMDAKYVLCETEKDLVKLTNELKGIQAIMEVQAQEKNMALEKSKLNTMIVQHDPYFSTYTVLDEDEDVYTLEVFG